MMMTSTNSLSLSLYTNNTITQKAEEEDEEQNIDPLMHLIRLVSNKLKT